MPDLSVRKINLKDICIAIENPRYLIEDRTLNKSLYGYKFYFVKKYAKYVFVQNKQKAKELQDIITQESWDMKVITDVIELNSCADVFLVSNPRREELFGVDSFTGIKIADINDHHMKVRQAKLFLDRAGVDYLIAGGRLDQRSDFFKKEYADYIGKVIHIPYGYADRFKNIKPFSERINKAVSLGSMNMVCDHMQTTEDMQPVVDFFRGRVWTHEIRRYVYEHSNELVKYIDSFHPSEKQQKDFSYDAVERLNEYKMFINDAGNFNWPPLRTYEGTACGCVMVAADNIIYEDIGFRRDFNYIAFKEGDYEDMIEKISFYQNSPDLLDKVQRESLKLMSQYTQERAADLLYETICSIVEKDREE